MAAADVMPVVGMEKGDVDMSDAPTRVNPGPPPTRAWGEVHIGPAPRHPRGSPSGDRERLSLSTQFIRCRGTKLVPPRFWLMMHLLSSFCAGHYALLDFLLRELASCLRFRLEVWRLRLAFVS